jgi:Tfp pilus assembly protein PilN
MNIDINILPKEMRAKPLVDTRTVLLAVLVIALAFGIYYFFQARSDVQADNEAMQTSIEALNEEAASVSSDPQAVQLTSQISATESAALSYKEFVAGRVDWGDALGEVYALRPKGVDIVSITQVGNNLNIVVTASDYSYVADYGRDLHDDPRFVLLAVETLAAEDNSSVISISVAPGGAQ